LAAFVAIEAFPQWAPTATKFTMKKLDELAAVISPPDSPRVTLGSKDWLDIFSRLGTRLPEDFVQFHQMYGEGYFCSVTHPSSANLNVCGGGRLHPIRTYVPQRLSELRILKERSPKSVPTPLYWETKGLLPWGTTTNGTDLCWRVTGELVDDWTVAALRTASKEIQEFPVSMTEFLRGIIDRTIDCSLMPLGIPGEKGIVWKVSNFGKPVSDDLDNPISITGDEQNVRPKHDLHGFQKWILWLVRARST
jgi:hypothetical protein